jgi:2-methylcitrate dehydratase PrpD
VTEQTRATGAVIDFIVGTRWADIPADVVALSKRCIIDGIGVMLAGSNTPASHILRDYAGTGDRRTEATILGPEPSRGGAASAALINGTSGHAHDFDDTQLSSGGTERIFGLMTHPTVPPLAAALALGERLDVSGATLLEAFAVGFEVECKIADAIHPNHYKKGFHSSGTIGTFGAMAAAAKLLGLDATAIQHALAIAASLSSGIRVNFGTMTKPLHVGRAAHNGIVAAELAARGFTGGGEGLDGPWGFFQVFSHGGGFEPERIIGKLGTPFTIVNPGVSIKPYPCGVLGHPSMDAMRRLIIGHDVAPERITAIRLRAGSNILNPLRYKVATSELEAKFCPAFMLSSIALRRKAGIREFSDEFVRSAPVQRMMRLTQTVLDPAIEALGFEKIRSTVEVDLADGTTLVEEADVRYRGGPDFPFTREELHEKFRDCAELVLPSPAIADALDALESLDQASDLRPLLRALTATAGRAVGSSLEA